MKERKRRSVLQSARAHGDGMRRPPGHLMTRAGREEVMQKGGGEEVRSVRMKHFLFRKQVLNWEYLFSSPSLLVRLPVTVANDIPKVYRAREVILGFFFLEVSLNSP